jgi:hypothetical protein
MQNIFSHIFQKLRENVSRVAHDSQFRASSMLFFFVRKELELRNLALLKAHSPRKKSRKNMLKMRILSDVHSDINTSKQNMAVFKFQFLYRARYKISVISFICTKINLKQLKDFS